MLSGKEEIRMADVRKQLILEKVHLVQRLKFENEQVFG